MALARGDAEHLVDRDGDRFRTAPAHRHQPDASITVLEPDFARFNRAVWIDGGAEYLASALELDQTQAERHARGFIMAALRKAGWQPPTANDVSYVKARRFRP